MPKIINALSVDVEDYFHVSAFAESVDPTKWDTFESRVEKNTDTLLELFDAADTRCTFFVLGWVAERHPALVSRIANQGHEIACHGYSHQLVYNQPPVEFRAEADRCKKFLEDTTGKPVLGYRAASYSIIQESLWALEILAELGFKYDSSIFPVRHDRYGIPGSPTTPYNHKLRSGRTLMEFPLSTVGTMGLRLPVAGGGYFRLLPYFVTRTAYRHLNNSKNTPVIFYMHPWEIDPKQPRISASGLSRFRHYTNLAKTQLRLSQLLGDFDFDTVRSVLDQVETCDAFDISDL